MVKFIFHLIIQFLINLRNISRIMDSSAYCYITLHTVMIFQIITDNACDSPIIIRSTFEKEQQHLIRIQIQILDFPIHQLLQFFNQLYSILFKKIIIGIYKHYIMDFINAIGIFSLHIPLHDCLQVFFLPCK